MEKSQDYFPVHCKIVALYEPLEDLAMTHATPANRTRHGAPATVPPTPGKGLLVLLARVVVGAFVALAPEMLYVAGLVWLGQRWQARKSSPA